MIKSLMKWLSPDRSPKPSTNYDWLREQQSEPSDKDLVVRINELNDELVRRKYQPNLRHGSSNWFIVYVRNTTEEIYPS